MQNALQRYFAALGSSDPVDLKNAFSEDAVWSAPGRLPNSGIWRGSDAIVNEFFPIAHLRMTPNSFATKMLSMTIGEDNAVVEWEATAETITGNSYQNRYMANFIVRDGKIVEVREYFDTQRGEMLFA
ncbi:hypothetical protein GCM10022198_25650 [Klugiella xanthotipulae]